MTGEHLRQTREARGLELEEVSSLARIPVHYLRALEEGDLETLPPGPFHRGYHRQYRSFLGLASESSQDPSFSRPAVASVEPTPRTRPRPLSPEGPVTAEPGLIPILDDGTAELELAEAFEDTTLTIPRHEEVPIVRLLVTGFIVTFAVLVGLRLGATLVDVGLDGLDAGATTAAATASAEAASADAADGAQEADSDGAAAPVAAAPVLVAGIQRVKIRTVEPLRVRATVDGEVTREGRVAAGESLEFEGQEISIWLSDLSVVSVYANGERVEPLHNLTASRTLRFVHDG